MTDEQNQQDPQPAAQEAGGDVAGESSIAASEASGSTPIPTTGDAPSATSESPTLTLSATPAIDSFVITGTTFGTTDAPAVAEPGEDAASPAGNQSASDISSSASPASPVAATLAEGASDVKSAIARLREHLWTFDHWAVSHLHAELDKIEALFK
ncbi:hypothetical protein B7759_01386 [Burkholderia glumae]|uniref:hypothetical protein n=1 Tax=Burkholderia glumae TaxID=337 RepID=UPI001AEAED5B|nr:hypothetical protein [Burkholderia glumae]QTP32808.1 hypothetical protein B7759_01386 [Burkholderia glumae]